MFTVQIGQEIRTLADLTESWVNQQIKRRRMEGLPVCVIVTIKEADVDVVLPTPGCGPRGVGRRKANPKERRVIDLWKERHLDSDDFTGGNLNAFLKQVQRI